MPSFLFSAIYFAFGKTTTSVFAQISWKPRFAGQLARLSSQDQSLMSQGGLMLGLP